MAFRLSPPCMLTRRAAGTAARAASITAAAMMTAFPEAYSQQGLALSLQLVLPCMDAATQVLHLPRNRHASVAMASVTLHPTEQQRTSVLADVDAAVAT